MPLYEYYCEHCNGVFELIRPVRDAARPQPCPECDDDAKRIVSKEWAAFISRDGIPRRLPDRGKYWNLFEEKDTPMTTSDVHPPEAKPRHIKGRDSEDLQADPPTFHSEVTAAAENSKASGGFFKSRARRIKDNG
ncbi:MAG: zinc ribbon domain-containing protein [Dehalococcoidia bacterium]|nr:zinc ribbon domain-containing protein [Dehalococcoidia bacterium]